MSEHDELELSKALSPDEQAARKRRNIWLGFALAGFVILVLLITVIRLANGIPERM